MKRYLLSAVLLLTFSKSSMAQTYGETQVNNTRIFGQGFITWWRILTGPSDSGNFTHFGMYVGPNNAAAAAKMSLYDHDPTDVEPNNLLANTGFLPVNGAYNEIVLPTPYPLAPNTYYWIGVKGIQNLTSGSFSPQTWPYTVKYISHSYNTPWPDPAPAAQSSILNPNNHTVYLVANNMTVPVEFQHFTAEGNKDEVKVSWATASETTNQGFNVQRTNDGTTWKTIGWVDGQGESRKSVDYEFIDNDPQYGLNAYRIEQEDYNGTVAYSEHRSVFLRDDSKSVYPNPATDDLNYKGYHDAKVSVSDASGRLLFEGTIDGDGKMDISSFPSGMLNIVITENNVNQCFQIIKK